MHYSDATVNLDTSLYGVRHGQIEEAFGIVHWFLGTANQNEHKVIRTSTDDRDSRSLSQKFVRGPFLSC